MRDKLFLLTTILAVCNSIFIIGQTIMINWPAEPIAKTGNISASIDLPGNSQPNSQNIDEGVITSDEQTPPPTVEYDENSLFGVITEVRSNEVVIQDITSTEDRFITVRPTNNAIITDSISVLIEDIESSDQYQLSQLPEGASVNINCQTISDSICTTDLIRFARVQPN